MCGISGIINQDNAQVSIDQINAMNDLIVHRGPDDQGSYFGDTFAFGHRRLSIIDLSPKGRQPMEFLDRYVITYNGEVYNYLELKQELLKDGYVFDSETDTEVILACYDKWGASCVSHFNGMWAFAIYDKKKRTIFCSRDRFGIKPFCYTSGVDKFLFASEAKQFAAIDGFKAKVNEKAAVDFLANSSLNQSSKTFFENVQELRAGHNLIYDLQSNVYEVIKWYHIEEIETNTSITYEEAAVEFRRLFEQSVRIRLRSDVTVGACLSGGLDSSSIVSMVRIVTGQDNLETISACYKEKAFDEQEFIDAVIDHTKVAFHKIFPKMDDILEKNVLGKIIYHQDQPILSASHFSEFSVFEAAKKHGLTVMLDGQGADEYLAGYGEFYSAHFNHLLMNGHLGALVSEMRSRKRLINKPYFMSIKAALRHTLLSGKFKPSIPSWLNAKGHESLRSMFHGYRPGDIGIQALSKIQLKVSSIPFQLHSEDRNSMLHSIESRLPFLDYRLVEFVLSLPDNFKIRDGVTKAVMRTSFKDILPDKVYNRHDKMGFVTPEEVWMRENSNSIAVELETVVERSGGLINSDIIKVYRDFIAGNRKYDLGIFRALSYGKWLEVFNLA